MIRFHCSLACLKFSNRPSLSPVWLRYPVTCACLKSAHASRRGKHSSAFTSRPAIRCRHSFSGCPPFLTPWTHHKPLRMRSPAPWKYGRHGSALPKNGECLNSTNPIREISVIRGWIPMPCKLILLASNSWWIDQVKYKTYLSKVWK